MSLTRLFLWIIGVSQVAGPLFDLPMAGLARADGCKACQVAVTILRVRDIDKRHPGHFLLRVAEHVGKCLVDVQDARGLRVGLRHAHDRLFEHCSELTFPPAQGLLRLFALGDVHQDLDRAARSTVLVPQGPVITHQIAR